MAISKAKEEGREAVICASTGNTSAAAAAYASRGGLKSYVLIPDGYVAQGKLAQALMYGAEIISIQGNFCLLYTSPSPRDATLSRMPSSA